MIDLTWKLFSQTGNIEAYLLMKELEQAKNNPQKREHSQKDFACKKG